MVDVSSASFERPILYVGRYAIFNAIARGGFASVHLARSFGAGDFARTVAIKRLHRQFAQDPEVGAMFLDEAHLVARIRHPNVLPTLDLIADDDELMIVMEYVEGVTLRYLMRYARKRNRSVPLGIVLRAMVSALRGLHAAHEARDAHGERLDIIHRDVSPDNILIGTDGLVRILDFGVAKALGQYHETGEGEVRGKLAYMTPEQVNDEPLSHRSDVFSAAIVLWEAMTGQRLFAAKTVTGTAHRILSREIPSPSEISDTPRKLDGIVLQGLERDSNKRWPSAERFASALEAVGTLASEGSVARYVKQAATDRLRDRQRFVETMEAAQIDLAQLDISASASMTSEGIRRRRDESTPPPRPEADADTAGDAGATTGAVLGDGQRATEPRVEEMAGASDTDADLGVWSDPPRRSSFGEGTRAFLPYLVGGLMVTVLLLLLLLDESDTGSSHATVPGESAAPLTVEVAPAAADPSAAELSTASGAPDDDAMAPAGSSDASATASAVAPNEPGAASSSLPGENSGAHVPVVPATARRPHPAPRAPERKPPPLYGRE